MLDARDSKMNKGKPLLQVASSPANLWEKSKTKIEANSKLRKIFTAHDRLNMKEIF